jgi:hypothetical protein
MAERAVLPCFPPAELVALWGTRQGLATSAGVTGDERDEKQHNEYPEKDLGNAYGAGSDASESEDGCHDGNDEKDKGES